MNNDNWNHDMTTGERWMLVGMYLVSTTLSVSAVVLTVHHVVGWFA